MPVTERHIHITEFDLRRLEGVISGLKRKAAAEVRTQLSLFEQELARATVVPPEYAPDNVVTMNTRIVLRFPESGSEKVCTLVFPAEADFEQGRISILSRLGSALIGRKVGEPVRYEAPAGPQEVVVERILYQPEAEGDFDR